MTNFRGSLTTALLGTSQILIRFTGKGAYVSNSVFLPAAGLFGGSAYIFYGSYGEYWSSTPNGSSNAYDLEFSSDGQSVNGFSRYDAYSVRAVLAE